MDQDSVEHRAAKVSLVSGLATIAAVACQLISVPVCLQYWGQETYGSWLTLYAAFLLVRSLDVGFITYVGNKLNYLYHQDQTALREHLASSLIGIAVIAFVQLSIGTAAFFSERIILVLGVSTDIVADDRSSLALLILIASWALSGSYLGIVHRLQIPTGLMYQAAWWAMAFQMSQFGAIILAAMLSLNMFQTSLLFAFVQSSHYLASGIYIRRKLPAYYPWWSHARARTGFRDLVQSVVLTVSNFIQQASVNGTIVLISLLSGPGAVPIFTTVRTLVNLWVNITNVLTGPLLPDVVRYHATSAWRKLVNAIETYWVLVGTAVNFGVFITYPLIGRMYSYWTDNAVALDNSLLCLLLASVVLSNAGGLISLYLNGTNRLGIVLTTSLLRAVVILAVGGCLFVYFGLAGFGIAIFAAELFVLIIQGYYFIFCELPKQDGDRMMVSLGPITLSSGSALLFLLGESLESPVASHISVIFLVGIVIAALWGWRGLEPGVKARLMGMIRNRFYRRVCA